MDIKTEEIYGTVVTLPEQPDDNLIEDWGFKDNPKEQYWRKNELPDYFDEVEYDRDGNALLTTKQREFALREVYRCKNGFWFYNNGEATYITGKHYFYLTWWKLEDDIFPDYRDLDRRYFLFLDHWEKVPWCLGVVIAKMRRRGSTSIATCNLVYESIFYKNSFCGLTSKTQQDAKSAFVNMISFGYRQLPVFLKPKQLNNRDSVSELVFAHKSVDVKSAKGGIIDNDTGHRSRIDYRAPGLNAYDSGRLSRALIDEGGKFPKEVPFQQFISIISKTLVKGAKKVGFIECPSTSNSLTNGGEEFKKVWDSADVIKYGKTPNRLVRYFNPAYDGYYGFIDKYGKSVIDEPTEEQYNYLVENFVGIGDLDESDIKLGAKKYILKRRENLTGTELEEEIRMNPIDESEIFMSANQNCIFDVNNINNQIRILTANPVYKRKVLFYRDLDLKVKWRDISKNEEDFCWEFIDGLNLGKESNKHYFDTLLRIPGRTDDGVIGVDGYSNSQGGKKYGSKASAWVFKKYDIRDPENTGLFIGHLYGRPKDKEDLHEQILLAAEYLGYKVWYEFVADDYYGYFKNRGRLGYLAKFPLITIPPDKKAKSKIPERHYGFPTTPFALTKQNDAMITYILYHCHKIKWIELLEDLRKYNSNERTPFDRSVSAMITLVASLEPVYNPPAPKNPLIKVYHKQVIAENN